MDTVLIDISIMNAHATMATLVKHVIVSISFTIYFMKTRLQHWFKVNLNEQLRCVRHSLSDNNQCHPSYDRPTFYATEEKTIFVSQTFDLSFFDGSGPNYYGYSESMYCYWTIEAPEGTQFTRIIFRIRITGSLLKT